MRNDCLSFETYFTAAGPQTAHRQGRLIHNLEVLTRLNRQDRLERQYWFDNINPATKLVIPAAAERRAGIQKRPYDYWIPAFAGMTEW